VDWNVNETQRLEAEAGAEDREAEEDFELEFNEYLDEELEEAEAQG